MLLYLTNYLAEFETGFNVFNYLTMRAILGALTALAFGLLPRGETPTLLELEHVGLIATAPALGFGTLLGLLRHRHGILPIAAPHGVVGLT